MVMNAADEVLDDAVDAEPIPISVAAITDIKWDEGSQWNNVYCSIADENFRAGESVEVEPPIQTVPYYSKVCAILQVKQQCTPQRVLLSLFLNASVDMKILQPQPHLRNYIHYPSNHIVWTRYQAWYPVTRVQREAFVLAPWKINDARNDAHQANGMNNAYCIMAKWDHDYVPAESTC
jgi:hypothetical protein